MKRRNAYSKALIFLVIVGLLYGFAKIINGEGTGTSKYEDLTSLFKEWREFQKPKMIDGVSDYSAAAMKEQKRGLEKMKSRLVAINYQTWPISEQVDFHLVRAEMNGLEFDHRVLRPWSRNPCFYLVISRLLPQMFQDGPWFYTTLGTRNLKFPLPDKDIAELRMKLRNIPKILEQAKGNLTEEAKDLWFLGIKQKTKELGILENLMKQLAQHHPDLVPDAEEAKTAMLDFRSWLEKKQSRMTAPSGIGVENYNWYLKNVQLVPYTWQDELTIVERELDRALTSLKLEEHRNRKLPKLEPVASDEEYQRRFLKATNYYIDFLREEEIFTVADYMHIALAKNPFVPPTSVRDFFTHIEYRDSLPMRCHGAHQLDELREEHDPNPSPIRECNPSGNYPLYNIWAFRAEGLATGMEEMMMHAGLHDKSSPRVRELIYILVANRAARAIGGLKMQNSEFTVEDAIKFAVEWTPRGWLPESLSIWYDMQLYLQQPGYGESYIVGKAQIMKLLADRAHQLGDKFSIKQFMDEFHAAGMIPIALTRWEMTGLEDEIKKLW